MNIDCHVDKKLTTQAVIILQTDYVSNRDLVIIRESFSSTDHDMFLRQTDVLFS